MTIHEFGMLAIGVDIGVILMVLTRFGTQALIDWQASRIQARRAAAVVTELAKPDNTQSRDAA